MQPGKRMEKDENAAAVQAHSGGLSIGQQLQQWALHYEKVLHEALARFFMLEEPWDEVDRHLIQTEAGKVMSSKPVNIQYLPPDTRKSAGGAAKPPQPPQGCWDVRTHDGVSMIVDVRDQHHIHQALEMAARNAMLPESVRSLIKGARRFAKLWMHAANASCPDEDGADGCAALRLRAIQGHPDNGYHWDVEFTGLPNDEQARPMRLHLYWPSGAIIMDYLQLNGVSFASVPDGELEERWPVLLPDAGKENNEKEDEDSLNRLLRFRLARKTGNAVPCLQAVLLTPDWKPAKLPEHPFSMSFNKDYRDMLGNMMFLNDRFARMLENKIAIEQAATTRQQRDAILHAEGWSLPEFAGGMKSVSLLQDAKKRAARINGIRVMRAIWDMAPAELFHVRTSLEGCADLLHFLCTTEPVIQSDDCSHDHRQLIEQAVAGLARHARKEKWATLSGKSRVILILKKILPDMSEGSNTPEHDKELHFHALLQSSPQMDAFFQQCTNILCKKWPLQLIDSPDARKREACLTSYEEEVDAFYCEAIEMLFSCAKMDSGKHFLIRHLLKNLPDEGFRKLSKLPEEIKNKYPGFMDTLDYYDRHEKAKKILDEATGRNAMTGAPHVETVIQDMPAAGKTAFSSVRNRARRI